MLNYNNHYITAMTYNSHTIKKAYGCDGKLVWKRQGGEGYENQYLTVIPKADGTMYWFGVSFGTPCYYSMDSGLTWSKLDETINVSEGQKIMLKKEWYEDEYRIALPSGQLKLTTNYDIEGNIMSMVYSDDFYGKTDLSGKDRTFTSFLKPNMVRIEGELYPIKYGPVNAENLVLPATTLSSGCYSNMFQGCEMLEKAPKELPAMELTPACYSEMFENCSNLIKAPFLPANILVGVDTSIDSGCYNHMFLGCRKLNEITCLATNQETSSLPANYLMHNWVAGVAETGTFYKYPSSRWRVSDKNGNSIPLGWAVYNYDPIDGWVHYNTGDEIPYTSERYLGIKMAEDKVPQNFSDKISFRDKEYPTESWAEFGVETSDPTSALYGVYGCDVGGTPSVLPLVDGYYEQYFSKPMYISLTKRAPSFIAPFDCYLLKDNQ